MGTCKPLPGMSFHDTGHQIHDPRLQMPDMNEPFWSLVFGSCQLSVPSFELWMGKQPGATNLLDRGPFSLGHQVFCCLPRVGQVVGFEHRRCLVSQQVSTYLSWHCIHHYVKDVLVLTRPTCNVFLISLSLSLSFFMAVYSMHKHKRNLACTLQTCSALQAFPGNRCRPERLWS